MKKSGLNKGKAIDFGIGFIVCFLLTFMLLVFGPAEIFFVNAGEFKFVYGEFAYKMTCIAVIVPLVVSLILTFLPKVVRNVLLSIVFGISVAGYIQVMFINKGLDLLGMNPEGYQVVKGQAIVNGLVWLVLIALVISLSLWKQDVWKKIMSYGAVFLVLIQAVALVSLITSADESAFARQDEGNWYISGEDQFVVSSKENIIVIVLDWFSNQFLEPALEVYPDAIDCLNDFTYYNNADCAFFGTYPSLAHFLSGNVPVPTISINEWTKMTWETEKTQNFYQALRDKNYVINVYTPDKNMLCGMNGVEVLDGTFSNLTNEGLDLVVNYPLLLKTMTKMSCYRFFPYVLKPYVYTGVGEYADVVLPRENKVIHRNYEFHEGLEQIGLSTDNESNYYIVQHLMGPHVYDTGADGWYESEDKTTREDTIKGCMVIVEEYLEQLKELGVYDNSTIIVTSDHGSPRDSQVIFFMKKAGEVHDEMLVNKAPISLTDYQATIAEAAGIDHTPYGLSVSDIPEDMERERIAWVRMWDDSLPSVPRYNGESEGASNAYFGFKYTGDIEDLMESYDKGPDIVIPETDCFF